MVADIATLLLESTKVVASFVGSRVRRARDAKTQSALAALHLIDAKDIGDVTSGLRLASHMRGSVTSKLVANALDAADVRTICAELLLVVVADGRDAAIEPVRVALERAVARGLASVSSDDARFFAEGFSEDLVDVARASVSRAFAADPEIATAIQSLASAKRTTAILERLETQFAAVERIAGNTELESFFTAYRSALAEVHGKIQPPDFDNNRRIPMENLYVAPDLVLISDGEAASSVSVDDFLDQVDRTVVLGDPGGGKTTLASFAVSTWSKSETIVPFHIVLREYSARVESGSIVSFIEEQLRRRYQVEPPSSLVSDLLSTGRGVVVFDGLDELIDVSRRREISQTIQVFAVTFPLARVLVTSRRVGYEQSMLDEDWFESFRIAPFTDEQVESYAAKWFGCQPGLAPAEADSMADQFVAQSYVVSDLRVNPLMLALMCILFRGEGYIPRNRPAIYEKCATLLFEKWDGHRNIAVPLAAHRYVDRAMKHLALYFLESDKLASGVERSELVGRMTDYLHPSAFEDESDARSAATEFVDFCAGRAWVFTDTGTEGEEPVFTFTHRTFMEYFAAVYLTQDAESPEALARRLVKRVARQEWEVVAQLAVQLADRKSHSGTERVLTALIRDRSYRRLEKRAHVLVFVAKCLPFAIVSPAALREISIAIMEYTFNANLNGDRATVLLRPWAELANQSPADYCRTIIDVAQTSLDSALEGSGIQAGERAEELVMLGLVRRFNMGNWGPSESDVAWGEMFLSAAWRHRDRLLVRARQQPTSIAPLILNGLIDVTALPRELPNLGFVDLYLGVPKSEEFAVVYEPLLSSIYSTLEAHISSPAPVQVIRRQVVSHFLDHWPDFQSLLPVEVPESRWPHLSPTSVGVELVAGDVPTRTFILLAGTVLLTFRRVSGMADLFEMAGTDAELGERLLADAQAGGVEEELVQWSKRVLAGEELLFVDSASGSLA